MGDIMLWIDRKKYKEKIIEWLGRNDKYLIINVSDSREIMDIASCFESIQQTHCSIGVAKSVGDRFRWGKEIQ